MTRRLYLVMTMVAVIYFACVVIPRSPAAAQGSEVARQLEKRVDRIEGERLAERLSRLEALMEASKAIADTNYHLLVGVFATVALMLAERVYAGRAASPKRRVKAVEE